MSRAPRAGPVDFTELAKEYRVEGVAPVQDAAYWIETYLLNWARWMRLGGKPIGVPKKASGPITGFTSHWSSDTDAAYDHTDGVTAASTDAVINDLSLVEQCAINHAYLDAVYRFNREPFEEVIARAKDHVRAGLIRKGVWAGP